MGRLPAFWADYAQVDASRFPLAAEARAAIEKDGFYLMGGSIKVTEDGDSRRPWLKLLAKP